MFTQNSITPQGLTAEQVAGTYFLLYYQFIKNAFGLQYCNEPPRGHIRIRLLLDQFPDTKENIARFKGFVAGLTNNSKFRAARIQIAEEDITEAVSHEHAAEGGVEGRGRRYRDNCKILVDGMRALGFETLLPDALQAPIIVTFRMPADPRFRFQEFYDRLSAKGYVIYPGKLTVADSFRIGCIGRLGAPEMKDALAAIRATLRELGVDSGAPARVAAE